MSVVIHVHESDVEMAEELLDQLSGCSRHLVMLACLRYGLHNLKAKRVQEYVSDHRWAHRVRLRRNVLHVAADGLPEPDTRSPEHPLSSPER